MKYRDTFLSRAQPLFDTDSRRGVQCEKPRYRPRKRAIQNHAPMIPIYSAGNRFIQLESEERILASQQHFQLIRNRRGQIREAHLKADVSLDARPSSRIGRAFEQTLSSGHVYALGGVRGSGGRDLVGDSNGKHDRRDLACA